MEEISKQEQESINVVELVKPFPLIVANCNDLYIKGIEEFETKKQQFDFDNIEGYTVETESELKKLYLYEKDLQEQFKSIRKPFTDQIVYIQKSFTEKENKIEVLKNLIADKNTGYLTLYQKHKAKLLQEQQAKIQLEKDTAIEKTNIIAEYKTEFETFYSKYSVYKKTQLTEVYNKVNLENFGTEFSKIENYQIIFDFNTYIPKFKVNKVYKHHNQEQVSEIYKTIDLLAICNSKQKSFTDDMNLFVIQLKDKFAGRKEELIREAKIKGDDEKKRIADLKVKTEKEEQERIQKEQEQTQQKAVTEIQTEQQVQVLEQEIMAEISNLIEEPESYRYEIETNSLSPAGFLTLFMYWYDNEGKKLGNEKLQKEFEKQIKYLEKQINNGAKFENPLIKIKKEAVAKSIRKTNKL